MAINRNTTFNSDDMNFMDRDFGDSDMDNQGKGRVKKAIKLIFAPMKGLAKGFVDKAIEDNLSNLDDAKDLADNFTSSFREEFGKFKKEAVEFSSAAKEFLPRSSRSKFKGAFEDEDTSAPEDNSANEIRSAITSIFSKSASHQAKMTSAMLKSAAADRAINHAYMKVSSSTLASVSQSASSIDYFLKNVYTKYLEKDIELKYRSLHVASEIKEHINNVAAAFDDRGLMHELLESVKLSDSQKAEMAYKNKRVSKEDTSQYASKLPKNLAASIFEIPSTVLSFATLGLQSITGMGASPADTVESISRFIGKNFIDKKDLPSPIQKLLNSKKVKENKKKKGENNE